MKEKIKKEVNKFNKYEDQVMDALFIHDGWVQLYIDEKQITEGDEFDIYDRVRQINRENGNNYFDED
jgi:hypothetical protein